MKRLLCLALGLLLLSGCTPAVGGDGETLQFFAMDTVMSVTVSDGDAGAAEAVQAMLYELDSALSRTQENSEISMLNISAGTGNPVALSDTIFDLLESAVALSERTKGAFNPAVAPIMDAWGFTTDEKHVPSDEELQKLLPLLDLGALKLENGRALLTVEGMSVDLGGIAKGYAGDKAADLLSDYGVSSALVSLGGNITAIGTKPDGSDWRVAVRDPKDQESYLCILPLTDKTVSTSGGYERYFEQDGVIYHHIIDPKTGYPARSGLQSVSVVSTSGTVADALSTALFVMGEEDALELWRASDDFEAVLVRDDGVVLVTEGLENGFEFLGDSNGYTYEIIRR
ncbi:MAG: FAD:protein FMN transferase [Clostridia bacterium]|nr:FAD:protein FMN transferase [Clostridia bacterium]